MNITFPNGESVVHIAAQKGDTKALEDFVKHGGDLAQQDKEGNTPLHDCLEQVYFEGGAEDETKCEKFFNIWDVVVEMAATWWRKSHELEAGGEPEVQCKAVYFLRSCVENNKELSVLQFAADRGLVSCVQRMLATKKVFVRRDKDDQEDEMSYVIDVTNLCPEYSCTPRGMYTEEQLRRQGHRAVVTLLETLSEMASASKAGEILEATPMGVLTALEWRVHLVMSLVWYGFHMALMIYITAEVTPTSSTRGQVFSAFMLLYAAYFIIYFLLESLGKNRRPLSAETRNTKGKGERKEGER